MKIISLWQPYAVVRGFKRYETRPYPPPRTIQRGDRFGIASTKQIKLDQQTAAEHPRLQRCYRALGLPDWRNLPKGCIVGTVVLGETILIKPEFVMELSEEEYVYGDWRDGRYAWELRDPIALKLPIPVRGQQGIWEYVGEIPEG